MATIEILGWQENLTGFTGWDAHARSELKKRLRCGLKAPLHEIRRLARQIHARQVVTLPHVHDEAVHPLTQILATTGADIRVTLEDSNYERLLKKYPKRGGR